MWASFVQLVFCTYAITKFPKHFQILQKKILSNNKVEKKSCLKMSIMQNWEELSKFGRAFESFFAIV